MFDEIYIHDASCFLGKLSDAVTTFDQFLKPLYEARRGSAIDNVVVDADRHAQVFTVYKLPVDEGRFFCDAAERDLQSVIGNGDAPAAAIAEHAYSGQGHGAVHFLQPMRTLEQHP